MLKHHIPRAEREEINPLRVGNGEDIDGSRSLILYVLSPRCPSPKHGAQNRQAYAIDPSPSDVETHILYIKTRVSARPTKALFWGQTHLLVLAPFWLSNN